MVATPILAYSYVRFSSKGQVGNDSERRQIDQAKDYALTLGLQLAPPMKDLGISAFRGANSADGSALGQFYEGVKTGKIPRGSHLIVEAVDRLSREPPLKIVNRLSALIDAGIIIHILSTKTIVTSETINENPTLLPTLVWAAQIAHTESKQKSQRINQANDNRRRQARAGKKLKGPLGPAWVDTVTADDGTITLVLNESATAIRTIFELARTGMGAPSIARRLNQASVPIVRAYASAEKNAQRKLWYPSYVGRIVTDRRTIGEYQPGKQTSTGNYQPDGDPIPDYFPPVITPEIWVQAQAARSPKLGRKTGGRREMFSNLFTNGIAVCACNSRMVMRTDGGSKGGPNKPAQPSRSYLTCSNALHSGGCENKCAYGYERFEQRVLDALPALPWSSLVQSSSNAPVIEGLKEEIASAKIELQSVDRAISRLSAAIESDDDIAPTMLLQSAKKLEANKTAAASKLRKAQETLVLAQAQAVTDPNVMDELGIIRAALAEPEADVLLIRQKMHAMLARIIEYAQFDADRPYIRVLVRGGFCIEVPRSRKKMEKVTVGMIMYHPDNRKRDVSMNLPPMMLDLDDPSQLRTPKPGERLIGRFP